MTLPATCSHGKQILLAAAALVLLAGAGVPATSASESGAHLGVWEALGYEERGRPPSTASLIWEVKRDGTILTTIPKLRKAGTPWRYSTDTSKAPHEINLSLTAGPLAGKQLKGIYKVEKNILTVCFPKGNVPNVQRVSRPTAFDVSRRGDIQILRLKRVSAAAAGGAAPDPRDGHAVVFTALSDDFTVNGRVAAGRRDPAALARVAGSGDRELAALAKDAQALVARRLQLQVATQFWRRSTMTPGGIRAAFIGKVLGELVRPDAPETRNVADDLLALLQRSGANEVRVMAAVELLLQLDRVQSESLPPVLRSRFPKASAGGGSVSMSVAMERKLPAEMVLANTGTNTLRNVVVWYQIEMKPLPGFSEEEKKALRLAYRLGAQRAVLTKLANKQLQDRATGMGSRNIVFIAELKPRDRARITYELGTIRYSKRAVFSLYSEELKVTDREINGVREMQQAIEKRFGGKR